MLFIAKDKIKYNSYELLEEAGSLICKSSLKLSLKNTVLLQNLEIELKRTIEKYRKMSEL